MCQRDNHDNSMCLHEEVVESKMVRHVYDKHLHFSDQKFFCETCEKGFGTLSFLDKHLASDDHNKKMKEAKGDDSTISRNVNPKARRPQSGKDYVRRTLEKRKRSVSPASPTAKRAREETPEPAVRSVVVNMDADRYRLSGWQDSR